MIWIPGKAPPPPPVFTDVKRTGFAYKEEPLPPINWAEWLSLPSVYLWQAIALSCGIRPSTYAAASSADGVGNERDFEKRMCIALEHIKADGQIRIIETHEKLHFTRVPLQDVANLANLCNWNVPTGWPIPKKGVSKNYSDIFIVPTKPWECFTRVMDVYMQLLPSSEGARPTVDLIWAELDKDDPFSYGSKGVDVLYWKPQGSTKSLKPFKKSNLDIWLRKHLRA